MFRHLVRLAAFLLVLMIIAGCNAASEENLGQPSESSTATTAPVMTKEPVATTAPVATAAATFDCSTVKEIPAAECQALVAFYEATDGSQWADSTNWLATNTPCSWVGVSCAGGHVDALGLYFNELQGQLPADLADLAALHVLDLHSNHIGGSIPAEFGQFAALEYLDLSANQLIGIIPADLSTLAVLQTLNLASNALTGAIPLEFGELVHLRNLDLSHNQLSSAIPESLGGATALESMRLSDNVLSGEIPFSLGQLPSLSEASLDFNELTGSAPSTLFELPVHQLWGNQLDGTIDAGQDVNYLGATFAFDEGIASSVWPELVPARLAEPGPGIMWAPSEHIVFTLTGEEPQDHNPMGLYVPAEAQIQIYAVAGLNEEVQPIVNALLQLLVDKPELANYGTTLPEMGAVQPGMTMLPPSNAVQMFRAQAEYVDFAEGSGVRYLTMLSQGPVPVSNQDLFYTFQGLTNDGATYVAVYYPVSATFLPDSPQISEAEYATLVEDWPGYLTQTMATLNEQSAGAFAPDLSALDALVSSISVAGITPPPTIEGDGIWPGEGESVDNQPVLQWPAVPRATSYQVVVLDDVAFPPQVIIDQTVTDPMLAVDSPLAPGHYSWTVRAMAEDGTVLAELNQAFLVKDVMTLVAPAAGAELGPEVLLEWNAYPGAAGYQVIIIDEDAFPPLVVLDLTTTQTSMPLPSPLPSGSYSWTVLALDANGLPVAELTSNFTVAES